MKKKIFALGCLFVMAAFLLVGCTKTKETTVNKYITVKDGTLVAKEIPAASSDVNIDVTMNKKVIPGGTSIVDVDSPVTVKKVYVGVDNEFGYYEWVPSSTNYEFVILVNQDINLGEEDDDFVILVSILDNNGKVSEVVEKTVELIEVGTGKLQISLSFDTAKDVDLHVIEPNGEHVYYGHSTSENGGELDLDSNAGCSLDYVNNENITYGEEAYVEPGLYTVYVDLWENCDPSVKTNYVVSVYYGGALISAESGSNPVAGTFPVDAPSNYNNLSNLEPVMTFLIPDHGQAKTKKFAPKPLTPSAMEKLEMSANN